jgi:hypothetical protein
MNLGHTAYGHFAAQTPDLVLKSLGEPASGGQPRKRFLFHGITVAAENPAVFKFKIHSRAATRQIPDAVNFPVVITGLTLATAGTDIFF